MEGKGPDLVPKNRTWLLAALLPLIATLALVPGSGSSRPAAGYSSTLTERQRHHDDD